QAWRPIIIRCQAALGIDVVPILCAPQVTGPLTMGARPAVIVLPERLFNETSPELLASVLGHEMAHIRRRDFLLNLLFELLYWPLAFHPASGLIKRRLQQTRELACDEMATGGLVNAVIYARALVRMAGASLSGSSPEYTLGVFDADILEERIMKLIK